jgi:hypothetical protein
MLQTLTSIDHLHPQRPRLYYDSAQNLRCFSSGAEVGESVHGGDR